MPASPARALWQCIEPYHAVTYFTDEARAAFEDIGLRGFWRGYFAGRAAPLGAVGPGVVVATFYGFHPDFVGPGHPRGLEHRQSGGGDRRRASSAPGARCARCFDLERSGDRARRAARAAGDRRLRSVRASAVRREPRSARGRANRTSRCGTDARCCVSTAATATSRRCTRPTSIRAKPTCCASRSRASTVDASRRTAVGTTTTGRRRPSGSPERGWLDDERRDHTGRRRRARRDRGRHRSHGGRSDAGPGRGRARGAARHHAPARGRARRSGTIPFPNAIGVPRPRPD